MTDLPMTTTQQISDFQDVGDYLQVTKYLKRAHDLNCCLIVLKPFP